MGVYNGFQVHDIVSTILLKSIIFIDHKTVLIGKLNKSLINASFLLYPSRMLPYSSGKCFVLVLFLLPVDFRLCQQSR